MRALEKPKPGMVLGRGCDKDSCDKDSLLDQTLLRLPKLFSHPSPDIWTSMFTSELPNFSKNSAKSG